jgi:putative ABC transport system substrate-binding protein
LNHDEAEMSMRRREFTAGVGAVALMPRVAYAQQMQRVAILVPSHTQWQPRTFRDALQDLGYREGTNLRLDVISGNNELSRLPKLAEDLVASAPDVIVAVNTPGTHAAMAATSRIPIISAIVADPILLGIVKNIARPEANVTGVANMATDITSKRIALLKEAVPSAQRFALFMHPDEPIVAPQIQDVERSASALGIEYRSFPMRTGDDLQRGFQLAADWNAHAVVRLAGQGFALGAETGRLATQLGLPSTLMQRRDVEAGGLMSYFADHRELWRRIATYVDRILKGTPPSDLPFELPTRFEMVINLRTAKELGLTMSPSIIARADEVIE